MSPRLPVAPRFRPQAHLLRTTALASLLPLIAMSQPASADLFLDNASPNGTPYTAITGNWSDPGIWFNDDTAVNGYAGWSSGSTAVLGDIQGGNNATATLTIDSDIVVDQIKVEHDGYQLAGSGTLAASTSTATPPTINSLAFSTSQSSDVTIDVSAELKNSVTIGQNVALNYSGVSQGATTLDVLEGGSLSYSGAATGATTLLVRDGGELNYSGAGTGATTFEVKSGGTLITTSSAKTNGVITIEGADTSSGTPIAAATATLAGEHTGNVVTAGTTRLADGSTVTGTIINQGATTGTINAWLDLQGTTITGLVDNRGELWLSGTNTIDGDVINRGNGSILLDNWLSNTLTINGRLTNAGSISTPGWENLTIDADEILLSGSHFEEASDVILRGTEVINTTKIYNNDTSLAGGVINGGLLIEGAGDVTVNSWVTVDGDDLDITNQNNFTILANGTVEDLDHFENEGADAQLTIDATGRLFTDTLNNTGNVTNSGSIVGTVTNANDTVSGLTGTLTSTGLISGNLINAGIADLAGTIGGNLNNSGTDVDVTADLSVGSLGNSGTLDINSGAELSVTNSATNSGTLNIQGSGTSAGSFKGNLTNNGTVNSSGTVKGNLANNGTANLSGEVTGNLDNNSSDLGLTGNLKVGGLTNRTNATVEIESGQTLTSTGTILNETGGTIRVLGKLTGDVDNSGLLSNSSTITGDVTNNSGGVLKSLARIEGDVDNDGTANLTGTITGELDNSTNTLSLDGNLSVGSLKNSGSITIDTGEKLTSGGAVAGVGTLNVVGELIAAGPVINSGTLDVQSTGKVQADAGLWNDKTVNLRGGTLNGAITNTIAGTINVSGTSSVVGNLTNNGTITGTAGAATLSVSGGTFHSNGLLNVSGASTLHITADQITFGANSDHTSAGVTLNGSIVNYGDMHYNSGSTLVGGGLTNAATGNVTVSAALDADDYNIINKGDFLVTSTGRLNNVNSLENLNNFTINTSGAVTAQTAKNTAGTLSIGGKLNAPLTNARGARVRLVNDGELNGTLNNAGILTGTGSVTGKLTNSGRIVVATGDTIATNSEIENSGIVEVTGTLNADLKNATGSTTTLNGGTISKNVNNAGSMTGRGTISGSLTNSGKADIGGRTGAVSNSGTLSTSGNLNVTSLRNTGKGKVVIDEANQLTSGTEVDNQAELHVYGKLNTSLKNTKTAITFLKGGTITGGVQNEGWIGGNGTIEGTVENLGTASLGGSLNTIKNSGTLLTSGDLDVTTLTNTGTTQIRSGDTLTSENVVANRGGLTVAGKLDGLVESTTAAITTMAGGTITGKLTNSGLLLGSGTIQGAIVNSGTTRVLTGQTLTAQSTDNKKTLAVSGRLDSNVVNRAGAKTNMQGGTIDGTVTNAGTLSGAGTITGKLTNSGEVTSVGTLALGKLENRNSVIIAKGTTLSSDETATNSGSIRVAGKLDGALSNNVKATVTLNGGEITGSVSNTGKLTGNGKLTGGLINNGAADIGGTAGAVTNKKTLDILGALTVADLTNAATGVVNIEKSDRLTTKDPAQNAGEINISGTLTSAVVNDNIVRLTGGTINGTVTNTANLNGTGTINGKLINSGSADLAGKIGQVENNGTLTTRGTLQVAGLKNTEKVQIEAGETLISQSVVQNADKLSVAGDLRGGLNNAVDGTATLSGGTITGNVDNRGTLEGQGTIDGSLTTRAGSSTTMTGKVTKDLINRGGTLNSGDGLVIEGSIINENNAALNRAPGGTTQAAAAPAAAASTITSTITVAKGTKLTAQGGVTNQQNSIFNVAGTLATSLVENYGSYNQTGRLQGDLITRGSSVLGGTITGDLTYDAGTMATNNGLSIGGKLTLNKNHTIGGGNRVSAANTLIASGSILTLNGRLDSAVNNQGTLAVNNDPGRIGGNLHSTGIIDMENENTAGALTLAGLSGNSTVRMDISTGDNLRSDRIVIDGGRTTGKLHFALDPIEKQVGSVVGKRVMLLDVDESFGTDNDFDYTSTALSAAGERIVYSVDQTGDDGDLMLVSQVNPAIGAMFANVTLVQSLIGSVINRPTSPYVTGLVVDSADKPCGVGGWGRATGGNATVEGKTNNQVSTLENKVSADYYGMQGGMDLACFDDRFNGWDMAFGALGGVNIGDSTQPIYAINGYDSQATTGALASITKTDFQQRYFGVYATASKDRWVADLQLRMEKTDFELKNTPVTGNGLGITDPDFSSDGYTLSGSISYSMPIAKSGWNFTPTMGFAWSKYSTDSIRFDDGFWMEFDDSERKVGFVGATVSKAFVRMEENAAIQTFATATYYKDFADDAVSRLYNDELEGFDSQVMTSENLKSFGEVSLGANYVKVLNPGQAGGARQFSTSARIDGRFGDTIDSVGVTGQIRWQF